MTKIDLTTPVAMFNAITSELACKAAPVTGPTIKVQAPAPMVAKRGQKLIIYAGAIGAKDALGSTKMPIPKYCWKVVYTPDKVWCILFPNEKTLNPNWQTYSISLAQLKKMTGYKFP